MSRINRIVYVYNETSFGEVEGYYDTKRNHIELFVDGDIKINTRELEAENKKLREALEFYANDGHIREYNYGQMVMLESEECEEGEDEKILPNRAGRVLASLNETR